MPLASRRIAYFSAFAALWMASAAYAQGAGDGAFKPYPMPAMAYLDESGKNTPVPASYWQPFSLTAVHFWATWCAPCVEELPALDAAQARYKARGLNILAIALDGNNTAKVQRFFAEHGIQNLSPYLDGEPSGFFGTKSNGLPITFFVDSEGDIIARAEGPMDWEHSATTGFLDQHLKPAR